MKKFLSICLLLLTPFCFAAENNILMETSKGQVIIELNAKDAPKTVANFLTYIKKDNFTETTFHRVINGFMIQGGGFYENGNRALSNKAIVNESNNGLSNLRGTIAMARTNNPHSATRQFYINHKDNLFLDFSNENVGYCVFGKVIKGMDVVDEIARVKTGYQDKPTDPVIIKSIKILE